MSSKDIEGHLKGIIELLKEEKEVLVKNEGDALIDVLNRKSIQIEALENFKDVDLEDEKIMSLIEEINSLQELNLLLTRQALSFQESFLDSLSKAAKSKNTYGDTGNYDKKTDMNIIDRDV